MWEVGGKVWREERRRIGIEVEIQKGRTWM